MAARGKNRSNTEQYLKEGLLALLPLYDGDETGSIVHTLQGKHHDPRSVAWLVQRIASYYHLDLGELRRRCGQLLGQRHHISLPVTAGLVLLPVRTRRSRALGETTIGFISLPQIEEILPAPADDSPVLSVVLFRNGLQLESLNTRETLEERIRQGHQLRREAVRRRTGNHSIGAGADEIIDLLPPCECILKDIFVRIIKGGGG